MVSEMESTLNILREYSGEFTLDDNCKPRIIDPDTGQMWRFKNTLKELENRSRELHSDAEDIFRPTELFTPGGCLFLTHLEEALATAPDNPEGTLEIIPIGIRAR